MIGLVKFNEKIGAIVIDDDPNIIRFIDIDHVLYLIDRREVELKLHDDIFFYDVLGEPVTSYYYNEQTDDAFCALSAYLNKI